jgi:cell division protein FtsA
MRKEEIIVGLDIGTTKIACLVGRKNEYGKIEIIGMGKSESIGVTRGVVSNIANTVDSIKAAVQEAELKANVTIDEVCVGIAGQHIKSLQHQGILTRQNSEKEISADDISALINDMHKLVMLPGEEIIHVLPQEYTVDNEQGIKDPIGMFGVRLEASFHIITGQVTSARNIYHCIERAGLKVTGLMLEPLASSESVITHEEKEAGVVLVDIGGGTTDIAIFQDGIIRHTAVIPFGGNVITEDIKQGCSILKKQAELLKVKFGSAIATASLENEIVCIPGFQGREPKEISVRNLAHICQARMEEIIEQVHHEIRNSGFQPRDLIGGAVITGGGSQLKNIKQLFSFVTGMEARIGYPSEHVGKSYIEDIGSPNFATGVGLAMLAGERKTTSRTEDSEETEKFVKSEKLKKGNFFEKILAKGMSFLDEDGI